MQCKCNEKIAPFEPIGNCPCVLDLIPTDRDELRKLFQVEEDYKVDFFLKELKILFLVHINGIITWEEETKDICLQGIGQMKGHHILHIFSKYLRKHAGGTYDTNEVYKEILRIIFEK